MNFYNQKPPALNPDQFKQIAPNLTPAFLSQLVRQAREKGISEQDIEKGLKLIQSLK